MSLKKKLIPVLATLTLLSPGGEVNAQSKPDDKSPKEPEVEIELPDKILNELIKEQKEAIRIQKQLSSLELNFENTSAELKWILENIRMDFWDVTTGNQNVSLPGEVHLIILISNLNSPESPKKIEILENYDPSHKALGNLGDFGFHIDQSVQPRREDPMDDGVRSFWQMDLNIGKLAEAMGLNLPANLDPDHVIPGVGQLVIETTEDGRRNIVRDILPETGENKLIFRVIDRIRATEQFELEQKKFERPRDN